MRTAALSRTTLALLFLGLAALASAAAAKTCAFSDIPLIYIETNDGDGDLLNDSFFMETQYAPTPPEEVWLNVTVFSPAGPPVDVHNGSHSTDNLSYTYEDYTFALLNITDSYGLYVANVTFDYTNGSCTQYAYAFELYPPGVYQPRLSAAVLAQSADENTTVTYLLNLANDGNNPDSFSFYMAGGQSWTRTITPLNPTLAGHASTVVNLSVVIPHNEAPLTADTFNLSVTSARSPGARAYLDITTTVNAQIFAIDFTADNASQEAIIGTTLSFGFHLTNRGNNRDTVTMTVPTAPSGWQSTVPGGILAPVAGEVVPIVITVRLPFSYTSAFRWDFWVNVTAGDGVTRQAVEAHARLILPDFVVGPSGFVVNNSTPDVGSLVQVQVTILNVGGPIGVTFAVSLRAGATNATVILDMTSLGSALAVFNWTAVAGATTLEAFVDSTGSVPEDNETNNRMTIGITTNLRPTAVAANATATGHPGDPISISAAGSSDADGVITAYFYTFGDGTNSEWVSQSSVTHAYNQSGNYTVTLRVRDNHGSESAPATEAVSITPVGSGGGGGGGGGGNGNGNQNGTGTNGTSGGNGGAADSSLPLPIIILVLMAAAAGAILAMRARQKSRPPPSQSPPSSEPPAPPPAAPPPAP